MNKELNASYQILEKVCIEKSYVSIELNKFINNAQGINVSLITKIVYGVLEKDISLEYFIAHFVKKLPNPKILILYNTANSLNKADFVFLVTRLYNTLGCIFIGRE